ncbi:MAG TPA: zf-HC2 domain-containing protein [Myxococcota bacterium]|nr:zf-HC2 domain-containing protein [Myxococcota bacterium]
MRHWQASRLLSSLPDGLLCEAKERQVRAHLARCARCRFELRALEASEALLRRVPATLLPLSPSREATGRLALLARWAARGEKPSRGRWIEAWGIPTAGALLVGATALSLALFASTPPEAPATSEAFNYVLAGELSARSPAPRTSPIPPPSFQLVSTTLPELAFLPPGVR